MRMSPSFLISCVLPFPIPFIFITRSRIMNVKGIGKGRTQIIRKEKIAEREDTAKWATVLRGLVEYF